MNSKLCSKDYIEFKSFTKLDERIAYNRVLQLFNVNVVYEYIFELAQFIWM